MGKEEFARESRELTRMTQAVDHFYDDPSEPGIWKNCLELRKSGKANAVLVSDFLSSR
jgi:hypothetical protein